MKPPSVLNWTPLPRLRRYFPQRGKRIGALSPPLGGSTPEGREGGFSFTCVALLFLLLSTPAFAQAAGDAGRGKAAFEDRCTLCHAQGGEAQGPDLAGVMGRKAGTKPGASDALKASGLTWTPASLDKFLAGPAAAVPGTSMPVSVDDARTRADIIAYLATLEP